MYKEHPRQEPNSDPSGKKALSYLPVMLLCILAVVAMVASRATHKWAWPFNSLPLLIWIVVVTTCQRRWPALGNPAVLLLGIGYGALAGVGAAALLNSVITAAMTNQYYRYPYDSAAFAIILLLSIILFLGLAIIDYVKFRWKPLWVRLATALVAFFPCMLTAMHIMAYFEEVLRQYVS